MKYKLDEICIMKSGGTPKKSIPAYYNGNIPWVTISDFKNSENGFIINTENSLSKDGLDSINNRIFEKGTLLFAMYGSIGKTAIAGKSLTTNQAILGIKPKNKKLLNIKFLKYWFEKNKAFIQSKGRGATLKNLSLTIVKTLEIDLPNLETQDKIVAILDKVNDLIKKREKSIKLFDELLRATFLEMFGNLDENNKKWSLKIVDTLCNVQGGLSITPKRSVNPIRAKYLRVANVYRGYFNLSEIKEINVTQSEYDRTLLKKNDILIVEGHGNINEVGRAALWECQLENILHQNHLIRLRVKSKFINPIYLVNYFNLYAGRFQMKKISNTTSGLNTISSGKVKKINIPIPPITLQNTFSKVYLKIQENKAKLDYSKTRLESLSSSISQLAFKGELKFTEAADLEVLMDNDYDFFKKNSNKESIRLLIERLNKDELNSKKFYEQELYDKAKMFVFELLNEKKIKQVYDKDTQRIKLTV